MHYKFFNYPKSLNLEDYKNLDIVNENQIINYYQNNIDQYSTEETRDIEFVRFDNEIDKQTILNALSDNSEIFDDIKIAKDYINTIKKIKIKNKINDLRLILKKNETKEYKVDEILMEMNDLRNKLDEDYS